MKRGLKYFIGYAVLILLLSFFIHQNSIGNYTFLVEYGMPLLCSIFLSIFIFLVELIIQMMLLSERIEIEWLCIWFADLILMPFKKMYDLFRIVYSFCRNHPTLSKFVFGSIFFSPLVGNLGTNHNLFYFDEPRCFEEYCFVIFFGFIWYSLIEAIYQIPRCVFCSNLEPIWWSLVKLFKYAFITHPKKLIIKQEKNVENEITEDFLLKNGFVKKSNVFEQTVEINGKKKSHILILFDPIRQDGKQTLNAIVIFYNMDGQDFVRRTFDHVWLTKKQFYEILTNAHDLKIDVPFKTTYF